MTHSICAGLTRETSRNTFTKIRKDMEEMDQGIGIFSSKRFKDPGAMNLKKAVSIVRGLSEEVNKELEDEAGRTKRKRRRKTWPAMWKYKYKKKGEDNM